MATPTPRRAKTYRFALFGRRNAGKTCILAALAMERLANPKQFACTWLDRPGPNLLASLRATDPGSIEAFTLGKKWLDRAIEHLVRCDVPPPNPNESEAFRFLFQFTTPDHRTFFVEMIDYSGELIDSNLTDTELARRLRQHMLATDAILVLAEVPRVGEEGKELVEELARLKRAFTVLHGERQTGPAPDSPVVLALNKWDRRQTREEFLEDEELADGDAHMSKQGVREFLRETPELPYSVLVDTLHGLITDGRFKVFPLSAFGEPAPAEPEKRPDRPNHVSPLHSFGLEDGFVWACRQRDAIDLDNLEREVGRRKPWSFWRACSPGAWRSHRDVAVRFPAGTPERYRAGAACKRFRTMAVMQSLAGISLLTLLVQLAFFTADAAGYRQHGSTLAKPTGANEVQLRGAEDWLVGYNSGSSFRHGVYRVFFDSGEASTKLNDVRQERTRQRVEFLEGRRKEIAHESDEVIRVQAAKRLLEGLEPDDPKEYTAWCVAEIAKPEAHRKNRENGEALNKVEVAFQTLIAESSEDREAYRKLLRETDYLPKHKEFESDSLARHRLDLVGKIHARLVRIQEIDTARIVRAALTKLDELQKLTQAAEFPDELQKCLGVIREERKRLEPIATNEVLDKYQALIADTVSKREKAIKYEDLKIFTEKYLTKLKVRGDLAEAAADLVARGRSEKEIQTLCEEYPKVALEKVEERKKGWIATRSWEPARQKLAEWSKDRNVGTLMTVDHIRAIENQRLAIDEAEDRHLYWEVCHGPTRSEETIKAYLVGAPIGSMRGEVEAYRLHAERMKGKVDFKIEVKINWGAECWNDLDNQVVVWLDREPFSSNLGIKSIAGGSSDLDAGSCMKKLDDSITIDAAAHATSGTFRSKDNRSQGAAIDHVVTIRQLLGGGKTIPLSKFGNSVTLRTSLPAEPPLPPWVNKK